MYVLTDKAASAALEQGTSVVDALDDCAQVTVLEGRPLVDEHEDESDISDREHTSAGAVLGDCTAMSVLKDVSLSVVLKDRSVAAVLDDCAAISVPEDVSSSTAHEDAWILASIHAWPAFSVLEDEPSCVAVLTECTSALSVLEEQPAPGIFLPCHVCTQSEHFVMHI
jgi:hypothetical protein